MLIRIDIVTDIGDLNGFNIKIKQSIIHNTFWTFFFLHQERGDHG